MSVFGRRKRETDEDYALSPEDQALEDAELNAELDRQEAAQAQSAAVVERPQGPWDVADAPDDGVPRVDLGGLRVPVPDDTEVRVDVGAEGEIVAATLVQGSTALQLNAFAAPRRSGIWAEVRAEIIAALQETGGSAEEAEGPFGTELHAQVPTDVPGQGVVLAPARFLGVDGPRWFLRGLLTGPGATEPSRAAALEEALRRIVVVRGGDAMAVRDPLPLVLPAEIAEQAAQQAAAEQARSSGGLPMPERGPEITETR